MEPYKAGLVKNVKFVDKTIVKCSVVAVMKGEIPNRNLELIHPASRAVKQNEVIEIAATNEVKASPGSIVESVHYLGFAEVLTSGVICVNDLLECDGNTIGTVAGFELGHYPNHMNIVIKLGSEKKAIPTLPLKSQIVFIQNL